ncbi:hypothetical protein DM01DRAFT_1331488 [Hesseltinella vesiculosa]|uniref:Uncharacterized protein n=1 Tax=Hesseltinella vesiculosa TaxID=101127 RepID=A0A1X2GVG6_9FUNG|nr:hypothetical protein DM01DRAFT_1331488 [Hesseltinella vesiculosa]
MIPDALVPSMLNYAVVIFEAQSPRVSTWQPHFIDRCVEWCLLIESELAVLDDQLSVEAMTQAQQRLVQTHPNLSIPSLDILLDAAHQFYRALIENVYTNDQVYVYLTKTYQFFTSRYTDGKDNLIDDLVSMAQQATHYTVLEDINQSLEQPSDLGHVDPSCQGGKE